jgi:hypothetical protein
MEGKAKRLYNKPKISKVRLLPEEAVLQNCKTASTVKNNKCEPTPTTCNNRVLGS